jgi:predicted nucleic acid-binding protein
VNAYFDSSVVLRSMLHEPLAIDNWSQWELVIASELMRVEVFRAIDRLRVIGRLTDAQVPDMIASASRLVTSIEEIAIYPAVLRRAASPFASVVSTLDAIHISTALLWMSDKADPLVFVTHDIQQSVAARLAGLDVQTAP